MTRLRAAWSWFTSQGPVIVAFVLLAVAGVGSAVFQVLDEANEAHHDRDQQAQIEALQGELACRAELGTEASNIQGEIGQATALGLVAVARGDDAALSVQADRIEELAMALGPALERRAEAVERCDPDNRGG